MYTSYNCQYTLFNLLCIFIYIVNVIYGISLCSNKRSRDSTILSRRYDIPFGYVDILFQLNIYDYNLLSNWIIIILAVLLKKCAVENSRHQSNVETAYLSSL